jgi:CPA2 family monovalent cation:H+ antiporter-2
MHGALQSVIILLIAAVLAVTLFRSMRLPPLLGYLLVGVAVGPHALGWISNNDDVRQLAEIGVVFLMFSIGLEFSLGKLLAMRHLVFVLGSAQVGVTMALVFGVAVAVGVSWQAALVLGGALAMSSTAILAKLLAERLELNAEHGRVTMGILLFQDLAVVPLLVLIPALAGDPDQLVTNLMFAGLKAAVVLALLLVFGKRIMRRWFHVVARQKSGELFVLNVLLVTLGISFVTEMAGLSMALGAFVAGALISETEYRYQVEVDIKPFRDVLLGLFFVSIGMLLDVGAVVQSVWSTVILVGLVAGKTAVIFMVARLSGATSSVALRAGLALCVCGEFGFVLLAHAGMKGILPPEVLQPVLAAMVLSMIISPFIVHRSESIARRWAGGEWMNRAMQLHEIAVKSMAADQHVLICGFGRTGQNLGRFFAQEKIVFIALDNDPQRIREAAMAGESVVFGDAARREVLMAAGILRAKALVVTYADTGSAMRILNAVRDLRPGLPVVVRTQDDTDIDQLRQAGAAEVVAEIMESSLMLASTSLMLIGVPLNRVLRRIREAREQRYSMFRGFFRGVSDESLIGDDAVQPRLHSIMIMAGAASIGRTLGAMKLSDLNVEVTSIRRHNMKTTTPSDDTKLEEGDVIVVLGGEEDVVAAEFALTQP